MISMARVCTSRQFAKGSSVADQHKQVEEYANRINATVVERIEIQMSGRKMVLQAGQLAQALDRAKEINASICTSRLDRLSRCQISLLQLKEGSEQSKVEIHIASLGRRISEISNVEFSVMAMFADNERRQIQARVKRACRNRIGPIGKTLSLEYMQERSRTKRRKLAEDWAESINLKIEIVYAINQLRNPTIRAVASFLNGRGNLTRRGLPWSCGSLHRQISRLGWCWNELKQSE
ncbi:recombinase family protein [Opitutales bacterium]|nr:recombinase family protein [Opitutales bacterium]